MIGTNNIGQAMTVQIGLQGRLRVHEHQHNAVAGQVFRVESRSTRAAQ